MKRKSVSKEEFDAFLKSYPNKLDRDVNHIVEPPQITYNDFTLGNWPESVVASCMAFYDKPGIDPDSYKIIDND